MLMQVDKIEIQAQHLVDQGSDTDKITQFKDDVCTAWSKLSQRYDWRLSYLGQTHTVFKTVIAIDDLFDWICDMYEEINLVNNIDPPVLVSNTMI